jgi:hypothetical protein
MTRDDCNLKLIMKLLKPAVSILLLLLCFTYGLVIAQVNAKDEVLKKLQEYYKSMPYEEVFVHTDRDDYIAGEDTWFNIYVVDKLSGRLSGRSRVAYFELLNSWNNPVIQKRLLVKNGVSAGQVLLPDTLSSGMYSIRVYTNQMKNFLPGNCFTKSINVYNPFQKKAFSKKIVYEKSYGKKQNIKFYPESETLLAGIAGRIAVRVVNEYGKGLLFTGAVLDEKGDSITIVKTDQYGLGSFLLKPENGKKYSVQAGDSVFMLPDVKKYGFALRTDYLNQDAVTISVSNGEYAVSEMEKEYLILIQNHSIADYSEKFKLSGREQKIVIPETRLSTGVNQITLFDNVGNHLSDRLIYIGKSEKSGPEIIVENSYQKREKVTLVLNLKDYPAESPDESTLSLSVAPQSVEPDCPEIDDYMIFGTEFGPLPWNEAGVSTSDVRPETIDNFLMSTGSRWITWEKILSGKYYVHDYEIEEAGPFLSGLLKNRNTQTPDTGKFLFLSIPGKIATFQYSKTDRNGRFSFMLPVDQSKRDLIIQPQLPDNNITINLESSFSRKLPLSTSYYEPVNTPLSKEIKNLSINYQIGKIYGTSYKKEAGKDEIITPETVRKFYGNPEQQLVLDDFIKLPVMQEIFFELIPGVKLRSKKSGYEMRIMNPYNNIYYEELPLVMIDGVSINDMTLLANLDPETVDRIDVVKTTYLIGSYKIYGIVNVITRTGNFKGITLPDYAARLSYRVVEPEVSFNSPVYSETEKRQSRIPDLRSTLYWNPSIKPDKDGKVIIEFWTSDFASDYIVKLQGFDPSGKPVSYKRLIRVE